jgi:histone H3/H4
MNIEEFKLFCKKFKFKVEPDEEENVMQYLNDYLGKIQKDILLKAWIQSQHMRHKGIKKEDMEKAIEMTPQIQSEERGLYLGEK